MDLVESTLLELKEDYVGVWELFREAQDMHADETAKLIVLDAIRRLMARGDIQFGDFDGNTFTPMDLGIEGVVKKIQGDLRTLGRFPNIGEIGWLRLSTLD